jgi:hypothetical protein
LTYRTGYDSSSRDAPFDYADRNEGQQMPFHLSSPPDGRAYPSAMLPKSLAPGGDATAQYGSPPTA